VANLSIEDEVLGNIRRQPLGRQEGTVADLGLPLEFLRRVADRVIQASFRERWRVVVGSGVEHAAPAMPEGGGGADWVTVVPGRQAPMGMWEELRPADRSFRAPIREIPRGSGIEAEAENGQSARGLRLQVTGPNYYAGPGDGGSLDVLRQLVERCSDVTVYASVVAAHAAGVAAHARRWRAGPKVRLVVIPEPFAVSQWARDNAVAMSGVGCGSLLAPRWAGRGEEGGIFVPGESFVMDGLSEAGLEVHQSRLLFEGGNVMKVREGGRRVLLVGEGEIWRNVGMRKEEVLAAFAEELGADTCVALPAASFHIDLEVTVSPPAADGRAVAFVVDTLGAVRWICRLAADRLHGAGLMNERDRSVCGDPGSPLGALHGALADVVRGAEVGPGQYPFELAKLFRDGEVDSGVGNLQRVLFAVDWLAAEGGEHGRQRGAEARGTGGRGVGGGTGELHYEAYLRSLRRAEKDRGTIWRLIKQLGWRVVRVPAISAEAASLNPVNGLWIGSGGGCRYFLPCYSGFFTALDDAAAGVFQGAGIDVERIATGETQRRGGGLHCAVGVM
jgi:hypothetical protein